MHRFHLPPAECQGTALRLTGREAHHALHVLRLKPGQTTTVLNGAGSVFRCTVSRAKRDTVELDITEKQSHPKPPCQVTLLQAIPKGKAIESIIQKATELGAHRIIPLFTERTEIHLNEAQSEKKREKWAAIMIEAIKQCGNPWLPILDSPVKLSRYIQSNPTFDLSLLASLENERQHPRSRFQEYQTRHNAGPASLAVWIGPEGDFSPDEQIQIKTTGALPISLGPLVLRADTAAISALSVITHELTDPATIPGTPVPTAPDASGS